MLRHEKDRFLDNLTVEEVEKALGSRVIITGSDGTGLCDTLVCIAEEEK